MLHLEVYLTMFVLFLYLLHFGFLFLYFLRNILKNDVMTEAGYLPEDVINNLQPLCQGLMIAMRYFVTLDI